MKKIFKLDFDEIELITEADKIILNEKQAGTLVELLKAQAELDKIIEEIKTAIGEAGAELDPNFKGIKSDYFSFMYRVYGSRYAIDPQFEDQLPDNMIEKKTSYKLKTKEVEKYIEEVGELPIGVFERERSKTASLKLNTPKGKYNV